MNPLTLTPYPADPGLPIQHPFTRGHALDAGISPAKLSRLVSAGVLRRVVEGVYVGAQVPDSLDLRCEALALAVPPDAFICDRTAAWLYTGSRALGPNEHLAVPPVSCFRPGGRRRLRSKIASSGERALRAGDLQVLHGLQVTTPLRTALDLGRLQHSRDLRLWGMDNMLRTGAFTHERLLARIPEFNGQRGVVLLRALAPLVDPLSESFGESALRLRWYDAGLPRPELQISLPDDDGVEVYRLDMGLRDLLFAAEYDGREFHSDATDPVRDAALRRHDADRRTEILDRWGYLVEPFRDQHVFGQAQNAEILLRAAAARARETLEQRIIIT